MTEAASLRGLFEIKSVVTKGGIMANHFLDHHRAEAYHDFTDTAAVRERADPSRYLKS